MGLTADIAGAVTSAWTALGDIPASATYYRQTADIAYNTSTGAVTKTESSTSVTVIIEDYREDELVAPDITIQDRRFLVRASQLGFTPREHDRIVVGGVSYDIVRVARDPAGVVWTLQARGAA